MTARLIFGSALVALGATLLAGLLALYRNPLFEIYLASWGIC